jgi:hypothetical protein
MNTKLTSYLTLFILCLMGFSPSAEAVEEGYCHVFLIPIPDKTPGETSGLTEQELVLATELAKKLSGAPISAIYTSDELSALQTATLIAEHHDLSISAHPTLKALAPNTVFQRVGDLRSLGVGIVDENRGSSIVVITHESLVRFVGRYTSGGFKKASNFTPIEITSDGKSMYLSILKFFLG